jgi:hypothetical protein
MVFPNGKPSMITGAAGFTTGEVVDINGGLHLD